MILKISILSVFDRKLLSKCGNDAYFCTEEAKTYHIGYFTRKIVKFAHRKCYFGGHFVFFDPVHLLELSNEEYYSCTKLQEHRIKTVAVTVLPFFQQMWRLSKSWTDYWIRTIHIHMMDIHEGQDHTCYSCENHGLDLY